MLDCFIRIFIVIGGVSGVCALTWPGPFPVDDPVAVLVRVNRNAQSNGDHEVHKSGC